MRDIAHDPALLGLPVNIPDKWLGPHEVMNMYPDLYKIRNAAQKAFYELSGFLFAVGLRGEYRDDQFTIPLSDLPKLTAKTLGLFIKLLARYGMNVEKRNDSMSFEYPECQEALAAWQLLAAKCSEYPGRERDQSVRFMLWMHDGDGTYLQLARFCKPRNNCMVCTKGGKNRQFTVLVHHDGSDYRLCPEFVQMTWYNSDISREKIDFMLELNELQVRYGRSWHKAGRKV